jgi:adenine specific DNA methylase Mod
MKLSNFSPQPQEVFFEINLKIFDLKSNLFKRETPNEYCHNSLYQFLGTGSEELNSLLDTSLIVGLN